MDYNSIFYWLLNVFILYAKILIGDDTNDQENENVLNLFNEEELRY